MISLRILAVLVLILTITILLQSVDKISDKSKETVISPTTINEIARKNVTPSPTLVVEEKEAFEPPMHTNKPEPLLSDFHYPGTQVLQSSATELTLQSTDSVEAVTNWYDQLIRSKNMNAKTFVRTNTNGTILNKLSASNPTEELTVEITQSSNSPVTILVKNRSKLN